NALNLTDDGLVTPHHAPASRDDSLEEILILAVSKLRPKQCDAVVKNTFRQQHVAGSGVFPANNRSGRATWSLEEPAPEQPVRGPRFVLGVYWAEDCICVIGPLGFVQSQ